MKPIVKKVAAAVAIKKGVEKVQEMRKPKRSSFVQRLVPFGIVAAIAGIGLFVYKNRSGADVAHDYDEASRANAGTF